MEDFSLAEGQRDEGGRRGPWSGAGGRCPLPLPMPSPAVGAGQRRAPPGTQPPQQLARCKAKARRGLFGKLPGCSEGTTASAEERDPPTHTKGSGFRSGGTELGTVTFISGASAGGRWL